jgi:hypothetical protein
MGSVVTTLLRTAKRCCSARTSTADSFTACPLEIDPGPATPQGCGVNKPSNRSRNKCEVLSPPGTTFRSGSFFFSWQRSPDGEHTALRAAGASRPSCTRREFVPCASFCQHSGRLENPAGSGPGSLSGSRNHGSPRHANRNPIPVAIASRSSGGPHLAGSRRP